MNILLLTGIYDTKPTSGGAYLMRVYVQELRKQGHQVFVFYFSSTDKDPSSAAKEPYTWYLSDLKDNYYTQLPFHAKILAKLKKTLRTPRNESDKLKRYFLRDFSWIKPVLKSTLKGNNIDIIQVDFPWMMNVAEYLPPHIPRVFVSHEAQFVLYNRKTKSEKATSCLAYEMSLAAKYNALLTLTEVEAAAWKSAAPQLRVFNSPMGIELPSNNSILPSRANKLVFLGSGKHKPNLDGIEYFLGEIWPLAKKRHADLELHITGMYEDDFQERFVGIESVYWLGFVNDLATFLSGAISIVPIRQGSGIRVKILESMALGAPVVATPMAAEGIAALPGKEILLAPDAASFADAIGTLWENPQMFASTARQAKQFVYNHYELASTTRKRVELLASIIAASKL